MIVNQSIMWLLLPLMSVFHPIFSAQPTKLLKRNGGVRLVGGSSPSEGNVMVESHDGQFYPVCHHLWDNNDATVVCRQLGFSSGTATNGSRFGRVGQDFTMDNVTCRGTEHRLQRCKSLNNHDCDPGKGAGAICTGSGNSVQGQGQGSNLNSRSVSTTSSSESSELCTCGLKSSGGQRIVGGTDAQKSEFPWQVGLIDNLQSIEQLCGGTIISTKDILTAAHCVINKVPQGLWVQAGMLNTALESVERHTVCNIVKHDFSFTTADFDFAVVQLCQPLSYSRLIRAACLPTTTVGAFYENKLAIATGWGDQSFAGQNSNVLKKAELTTMNNTACCTPPYKFECGKLTARMMCAITPGKGSCHGDSGGPLVIKESGGYYTIIGVSSFGVDGTCASPIYPSVFARVTDQLQWIKTNMVGEYCTRTGDDSGRNGGQGQTTGSGFGQGQTAGTGSGQGQATGSGFGQGHAPGSGFGQGQAPGTGSGQGQAPGSGFGQGQAPGSGSGQGQAPGSGFGQGQTPGSGFGQGQAPGSGFGQGHLGGFGFGHGQINLGRPLFGMTFK